MKQDAKYPNDKRRPLGSEGAWKIDGRKRGENGGGKSYDHDTTKSNRRSVWTVTTKPFKGAHFATFPPDLIEPCVLAGTSERGHCPKCGARLKRVTEPVIKVQHTGETDSDYPVGSTANRLAMLRQAARAQGMEYTGARKTTGWESGCDCGCDPVPDTILDPFNGAGTTGVVSLKHGRHYIGCELNPEYVHGITVPRLESVQKQTKLFA